MNETRDLDAGSVILKDLELFNKAVVYFKTQIDPKIREEIERVVSKWCSEQDWANEVDVSDELTALWVGPKQWAANLETKDWYAWFQLVPRTGPDQNSYETADLFGAGTTTWGFHFKVDHGWFGGKGAWNKFVAKSPELFAPLRSRWDDEGKGLFFRAVILPLDKLHLAWESDDWSDALAPMVAELDALASDVQIFDKIIKAGKIPK